MEKEEKNDPTCLRCRAKVDTYMTVRNIGVVCLDCVHVLAALGYHAEYLRKLFAETEGGL